MVLIYQSLLDLLLFTETTLLPSTLLRLTLLINSLQRYVSSQLTQIFLSQSDYLVSSSLHTDETKADKIQSIRAGLADANRVISSSAPDVEKAEARIEIEVFEGLQAAMAK